MEQLLWDFSQKSIVAASFIYLLIYLVKSNAKLNDEHSKVLIKIAQTLHDVSNTLANIDKRIGMLEDKVRQIEDKGVKVHE